MCNPSIFRSTPPSRTRAGDNLQRIEDDGRCDDETDVGETFSQPT